MDHIELLYFTDALAMLVLSVSTRDIAIILKPLAFECRPLAQVAPTLCNHAMRSNKKKSCNFDNY